MKFFQYALFALLLVACAPQAAIVQVEVKEVPGEHIAVENKQIAVFAIASPNRGDSLKIENAAMALADKFGQDRGCKDPLPVFSLSELSVGSLENGSFDKEYLRSLMYSSGADMQILLHSLKFSNYNVQTVAEYDGSEYGQKMVYVPYSAKMDVYDAIADSVVFKATLKDTVYMSIISQVSSKDYSAIVEKQLPEVAKVVGESMGTLISERWRTQERMLVNYPGNSNWERGVHLANDFKWKEAIEVWMPLVDNGNSRISAYAAYNVAVCCEMLGLYPLALQWAELSVKKYSFDENLRFKEYLKMK